LLLSFNSNHSSGDDQKAVCSKHYLLKFSMTNFLLQHRGEFAALGAALIWASASVVYTGVGRQLSPLVLNFTKGWIAIALILLTFLLTGQSIPNLSTTTIGMLALSGIVGVGLGDTAYFHALNCIGARRTLLFETIAPCLSAFLAWIFLQETLPVQAWFGILLTLGGIVWVVLERVPDQSATQNASLKGLVFSLLAALGQAGGAVLSRAALLGSEVDSLWSTLIRLLGGTVILLVWSLIEQPKEIIKSVQSQRLFFVIAGTAFISTYLGIWLQQTSLKFAPTGIAQALTSTSPLFVLPVARLMGDRISLRSVIGVVIALLGVTLLFN
jgi:drug/metabolite transporter (DMT)-like permease